MIEYSPGMANPTVRRGDASMQGNSPIESSNAGQRLFLFLKDHIVSKVPFCHSFPRYNLDLLDRRNNEVISIIFRINQVNAIWIDYCCPCEVQTETHGNTYAALFQPAKTSHDHCRACFANAGKAESLLIMRCPIRL